MLKKTFILLLGLTATLLTAGVDAAMVDQVELAVTPDVVGIVELVEAPRVVDIDSLFNAPADRVIPAGVSVTQARTVSADTVNVSLNVRNVDTAAMSFGVVDTRFFTMDAVKVDAVKVGAVKVGTVEAGTVRAGMVSAVSSEPVERTVVAYVPVPGLLVDAVSVPIDGDAVSASGVPCIDGGIVNNRLVADSVGNLNVDVTGGLVSALAPVTVG